MFSPIPRGVFHFVVSFTVQALFSLMESYLSMFAFVAYASAVLSKKSLPRPVPRRFPPVVSFRVLQFGGLMFKSLVELVWGYDVKTRVQLHSFASGYPVFTTFIKVVILSPLYVPGSLVEDQVAVYVQVYF